MPPPKQLTQYMRALAKLRENGAQGVYLKVKEAQTDIRNLAVAQIGTGAIPASAAQLLPSEVNGYVATKIRDDLEALMTSTFRLTDVAYGSGRMASGDWDRLLAQSAYREQRIVTTQRARIQVMLNQHARGDFGIPNSQKARAKVRAEVEKLTGGDWRARRIARTETAITTNHAQLNNLTKNGYTTVRIFDGSECHMGPGHNNGEPASGRVVDLETANMYPISHPNCIRAFEPNRTKEEKAGTTSPPVSGLGPPLPPRAIPAQPTPVQPQPLSAAALQEQSLAAGINPSSVATLTPDELAAMRAAGIQDDVLDGLVWQLDEMSSSPFIQAAESFDDIERSIDLQFMMNQLDEAVENLTDLSEKGAVARLRIAAKANRKMLDDALDADGWPPSIADPELFLKAVDDKRWHEVVTKTRNTNRASREVLELADDANPTEIHRRMKRLVETNIDQDDWTYEGFATQLGRADMQTKMNGLPQQFVDELLKDGVAVNPTTDLGKDNLKNVLSFYRNAQTGTARREVERLAQFANEVPNSVFLDAENDVRRVYGNRSSFRAINKVDYGTYRYATTDDYKTIGDKLRVSGGDIAALNDHEKTVLESIRRNHVELPAEVLDTPKYRGFSVSQDIFDQLGYRPGAKIKLDTPTSFSESPAVPLGFIDGNRDVSIILEMTLGSGTRGTVFNAEEFEALIARGATMVIDTVETVKVRFGFPMRVRRVVGRIEP